MAADFSGQVRQGRDGSALSVRMQWGYNDIADADSAHRFGIGVKTTAGAPATFAAFAHTDGMSAEIDADPFWDTTTERYRALIASGVSVQEFDARGVQKRLIPLDADYAAGRYVWLIHWANNSVPTGSDVPSELVGPYLIR